MSKLRKKLITVLAVLFCALLCLSTALIIPKTKTAEADSLSTVVDLGDNGKFSAAGLRKLYENIFGVTTYKKLKDKLDNLSEDKGTPLIKHSDMTATTVKLGSRSGGNSLVWNVVAVSKNQQGDVIATLWLAESFYKANFSSFTNEEISTYASSEYSMSYIRSTLMGGNYAKDTTTSDIGTQNDTWETFVGKYCNFIDTPKNVCGTTGYQAIQEAPIYAPGIYDYLCPNDAYVSIKKDQYGKLNWGDKGNKVQKLGDYGNWQNDCLWLPSSSETGYIVNNNNYAGIWGIDNNTVRKNSTVNIESWLRSGNCDSFGTAFFLKSDGNLSAGYTTVSYGVRPAFHLNLAKAANGVAFDAVDVTNEQNGTQVTNTETNHTFTRVYDGNEVKVTLADYNNLNIENDKPYVGTNDYSQTEAKYDKTSGEFTATKPKADDDETYIIKVTPKTDPTDGKQYVWDDTDTTGDRYYKITIKAVEIDVSLENPYEILSDESLIQDIEAASKSTALTNVNFTISYKKGDTSSTTKPAVTDPDWKKTDSADSDYQATESGSYRIWYKVEAPYHKTVIDYYDVTVSADELTISLKDGTSGAITGSGAQYAKDEALDLTDAEWLKNQFKAAVTVKNSDGSTYNDLDWDNLEVVLFKYNGNIKKYDNLLTVHDDDHQYYNVGTYYLDLKYKDGANVAHKFKCDKDSSNKEIHPTFEVTKRAITVDIVPVAADGTLSHVYGDSRAQLKYEFTPLVFGEDSDSDIGLTSTIRIQDDAHSPLNSSTSAGKYKIEGVVDEDSNYSVTFDVDYEVKKRTVALKVADESVEYGTSFDGYKFKEPTLVGTLANGEKLSDVIKTKTYTLKSQGAGGANVDFSSSLSRGTYDLIGEFTADNYIFEAEKGTLTITKANFDMTGVKVENVNILFDGDPHEMTYTGQLPSNEIAVSYRYVNMEDGSVSTDPPVEIGLYLVYASFTHSNDNYNDIADRAAYLRIVASSDGLTQGFPELPTEEEIAAAANMAKKKADAKEELEKEAQAKKDAVDADVNLSAEEKKAAKDEIDKELKEGNAAIDKAKDADGISKAYDEGKKEIEDTADLAQSKGAAKSELDKAAQAKKDAIDNNPELTDEEKAAAKAEVDKELEEGKKAIDGANSIDGVQSAESSTKTNIENIKAEHKGSFPWWILAIIAGALVLVTVLIIVIVKRRNSEDDDGGYDDFYDDEYDYDEEEIDDDGDEAYGY